MIGGNTGMLPIRIILEIYQYAMEHPELKLLVTPEGCGPAGYTPEEMAPMFKDAAFLENVYLPISFWKVQMGWENRGFKHCNFKKKVV